MTVTDTELTALVAAWMWPLVRISAMVSVSPVFGARQVPARVRAGAAVVITLVVVPLTPPMPAVAPFSAEGMLVTAQEVLVGLSMGFAVRLVFVVLEVAGQLMAQLMGLGFASLVDPQSGVQTPMVSQFYILLATLVFLAVDGHLVIVQVLADSFSTVPVGGGGVARESLWAVVEQGGWVFASAVLMALPAMIALLTVNMAFGVMSRAAPQLNIFAVGFPISLVFGFVVMFFTLPGVIAQFDGLFDGGFSLARALLPGTR